MIWPRMRPAFRPAFKPLPFACAALFVLLAACASKPLAPPVNLIVAPQEPVMPVAPVRAPGAPPSIVRIWFSTLTLQPGTWFDGTIVASTNVASVEVRTAAFSVNTNHDAPGIFRFHTRVLEVPPLSRLRSYELYIIARNTVGDRDVERARLSVR